MEVVSLLLLASVFDGTTEPVIVVLTIAPEVDWMAEVETVPLLLLLANVTGGTVELVFTKLRTAPGVIAGAETDVVFVTELNAELELELVLDAKLDVGTEVIAVTGQV